MREEDKIALNIYSHLKLSYKELSKDVGEYSNIIGVFFHEIMIFVTNYYLIKNSNEKYHHQIKFPFLNTEYVKKPYLITIETIAKQISDSSQKDFIARLKCFMVEVINSLFKVNHCLVNFFFFKNKVNKLAVVGSTDLIEVFKLMRQYPLNILPTNTKAYLVKKEFQFEFLKSTLVDLFSLIPNDVKNLSDLVNSFLNYVKYFVTEEVSIVKDDFLISGSLCTLGNRIIACNFKETKKKVIACAHGANPFLDFDEPIVGYGEISICDYYIDYGMPRSLVGVKYLKPINEKFPQIYHMESKIVSRIHKTNIIKHIPILRTTKCLYISNGYSLNMRYGPFRDIEDTKYQEWQKAIISLDYNIIYKAHPTEMSQNMVVANKLVEGKLENIANDFDIIMVDFFGTAYAIAAATDKPIIHFNLGLRNMVPFGLSEYKSRVFWYDINLEHNLEYQINEAIYLYNQQTADKINSFTENASLNKSPISNISSIVKDIISNN